jgi:hypothetical protein
MTAPARAPCLAEIARPYGIQHWVGQSYMQVKDGLGWADFQVRSDIAIRRHQVLVADSRDHAHALVVGMVRGSYDFSDSP